MDMKKILKKINLGKKGMFFTLMAVIILGILLIATISDRPFTTKNRIPVVKARVKTADSFIKSIKDSYLERALIGTGYRAMYSVNRYMNSSSRFLDDLCILDTIMIHGIVDNSTWLNVSGETQNIVFQLKSIIEDDLAANPENSGEYIGIGAEHAIGQYVTIDTKGYLDSIVLNLVRQTDEDEDVIIELRKGSCKKPGMTVDTAIIDEMDGYEEPARDYTGHFQKKMLVYPGNIFYVVVKSSDSEDEDAIGIQINTDKYDNGWLVNTSDVSKEFYIDDVTGTDIMKGNTLSERLDNFSAYTSEFLHLRANVSINNFYIQQTNFSGPWRIQVDANYSLYVDAIIAKWNTTESAITTFPILGMEDLYYSANSEGVLTNTINKTDLGYWNIQNLLKHIYQRTYRFEPNAPSFLMRLQNITESSECCGIESIIYNKTVELEQSYADYCYFGLKCDDSVEDGEKDLYNVDGISNTTYNFTLELYHIERYNITGDNITWVCC